MKKYVFISNSTKPSEKQRESRDFVKLSNVNRPCLESALELGYEVYLGVNRKKPEELLSDLDIKFYDSHTYRNILNIKDNFIAYKNLLSLLKEKKIGVVHCNTPIGGLIGRLAGKRAKVDKVIYTAHGFHFYNGAPFINRTVFKLAEKWLARFTDVIITMNNEDYQAAKKFKLRNNGKVYYVPGVGVDTNLYNINISDRKDKLRKEIGINSDDFLLITMGDLIERKNFKSSIESISKTNDNVHLLICGTGPKLEELKEFAEKLGVENQIHFLGYRTDIVQLLAISDGFLFTSNQEGLPRSLMEAMSSGLPCIVSNIRGNNDLIDDGIGGYLLSPKDTDGISKAIQKLEKNIKLRKKMSEHNLRKIQKFDIENVKKIIRDIYIKELN